MTPLPDLLRRHVHWPCAIALSAVVLLVHPAAAGEIAADPQPPAAVERTLSTGRVGSELTLRIALNKDRMTVAERAVVQLTASAPAGWTIKFPEFKDHFGEFSVASAAASEATQPDGRVKASVNVVLEPFLAGIKVIPPVEVIAAHGETTERLRTEPITVTVATAAPTDATAQTPLAEARSPVQITLRDKTPRWRGIALVIAGASAYIGCFAAAWAFRRRYRAPNLVAGTIERLGALRLHLGEAGADRANCLADLAVILRRFATYHLKLPCLGMTGSEADPGRFATCGPGCQYAQPLSVLLRDIDAIRFGPSSPPAGDVASLVDRVDGFVRASASAQSAASGSAPGTEVAA